MDAEKPAGTVELGDAIENILIESGLSISDFSRKVGYSRQYVYELLRKGDPSLSRKVQLDTLKKICDATGYGLVRLLSELGYLPRPLTESEPNTIIVVKKGGEMREYHLDGDAALVEELAKSLSKKA